MEADLRLLSSTQLQKLAQPHLHHQQPQENPPSWMWNTQQKNQDEDDDSWEVRAFAQDTGNIMGTTWPPRSYTCTFCRREFRSAQALGGHMNVHRRDRAKLRQSPPSADAAPSTIIFPSQEFVASNGGVCLVYSLPNNPNTAVFSSAMESPSTILSISSYQNSGPPSNFTPPTSMKSSLSQTGRSEEPNVSNHYNNQDGHIHNSSSSSSSDEEDTDDMVEELDLELRLGARPSSLRSPHNKVY